MAQEKKDEKSKDGKGIYNRGISKIRTSKGDLLPGDTLYLPEKEAKSLLGYKDVVDVDKMVAEKPSIKELRAEIAKLKKDNEVLTDKLAAVSGKGEGSLPPSGK